MPKGEAFVTGWGTFLPNEPVTNDEIESVLGTVNEASTKMKVRMLVANGIDTRHYAIDRRTGRQTHSNAQLTAEAVRALARNAALDLEQVECLVCGTSAADQVIPAHGSMVHAELGGPPCEVVTTAGVCCCGMSAFKYGYLSVASGSSTNAVVTGSELASPSLTAEHFQPELDRQRREGREPALAVENDFLRWMLSDGAGALLISAAPRGAGPSLRIDWLDILSYATESPVCMYFGLRRQANGSVTGYRGVADPVQLYTEGYFNLGQDAPLLKERIPALARKALARVRAKRGLAAERIDWLLPHYSSGRFRQVLFDALADTGLEISYEKWFTNLTTRGNTGSASIYVILDELLSSGRLKSGQRLLCFVPESARMTFALLHLTVV